MKPYDVLDVLLDEDNRDPIVLQDNNGKKLVFEQVAIIPFDGIIYCVLKPQSKIYGLKSDEAVVFYVLEAQGEPAQLRVCEDERIARKIFIEYYRLVMDGVLSEGDDSDEED